MKYQRVMRAVFCAASICTVIYTAGCSVSFCGLRSGGEELTFVCGEESSDHSVRQEEAVPSSGLPVSQKEALSSDQSVRQEEMPVSEQSEGSDIVLQEAEDPVSGTSGDGSVRADGRVNINSAAIEELMTLKGIGETRAKAIVEYRSQNGMFTKAEDIMQVPGIKEGIFSKIQNQIAVD